MKIIKLLTFCGAILWGATLPCIAQETVKDITISHAWVRLMPPTQKITAAYMTITNNSSSDVVIKSASCNLAETTEIHQMSQMNGMMRMAMSQNLTIPPQSKVELRPGGFHLMLINLKKPLQEGDMVPIEFKFKDGQNIKVNAYVRKE